MSKLYKAWQSDNLALHLGLIIFAALVVWGATCGLWGLNGSDETRYTQIAKNLLDNGDVFLLTLDGKPYDQKPPLVFWLFAVAIKLCGGEIQSFAPRMVAVLFAVMMLCCTYVCGRKLVNAKTGLYGAFILATCPVFMNYAPKAKLDMVFAACITLAVMAIITRKDGCPVSRLRALAIWGGLAGAFFAKGPLALVIVLLFVLLYALAYKKDWWRVLLQLKLFWGLLFVFVLIGIWLGMEIYLVGPSFVTNQIGGETVDRMMQGAHQNPPWFYFVNVFGIIGLWTIALLTAFYMLIKRQAPKMPKMRLWAFWFLPGFILLCLASGKRVSYTLPLLPPLALFIGYYINCMAQGHWAAHAVKKIRAVLAKILLILGALLCLLGVVLWIFPALAWGQAFYVTRGALICTIAVGLLLALTGWRKPGTGWGALCGTLVFVMLLFNFFNNAVIYTATDVHRTSRYFSQNLTLMYPGLLTGPLGVINASADSTSVQSVSSHRFHVYGDYHTQPLFFSRTMFASYNAALPDYILMYEKDFRQLTVPPEKGGFAVAFWDRIEDKHNLVLLHRIAPIQALTPNLASSDSLLPDASTISATKLNDTTPGITKTIIWRDGTWRSPQMDGNAAMSAQLNLFRLPYAPTDIYTLNMQNGFAGNAYGFNWLVKQAPRFAAKNNMLVLANVPRQTPNGKGFNKWALRKIMTRGQIETVLFAGVDIDENRIKKLFGFR